MMPQSVIFLIKPNATLYNKPEEIWRCKPLRQQQQHHRSRISHFFQTCAEDEALRMPQDDVCQ